MVPTAERNGPADLQFSSFLTQLKAPPSSEDPMRPEQWSSPTSIATNPTDATTSTSQPLPSFTLDQQSNNYYANTRQPSSFSTPTGYYTQQQQQQHLLPPRDLQTTSAAAQWTAPTYSTGAPMVHGDYLPHPQPTQQPALHPLVLQHSEPIQRSNEEDLVMDAQMLREVLQEMPTGQTPVNAQHAAQPRGQQMPGLQLLFASPMHSTDMNAQTHAPTYFTNTMGMTNTSADMLLTMSQTAAPVAPIFQSMQTQDRTSLPGTLPLPAGTIGLTGAFDPLVAGAMVPPPTLPRKKRTTATRICKDSTAASAGSQGDRLAYKTSAPRCDSACPSSSEQLAAPKKKGTSAGFRQLREALMAKKFESHDNLPVEVDVVSGLFIGSYGAANNFEALKQAEITHVLCVSPSLSLKYPEEFTYLRLEVADLSSVKISVFFGEALSFIDSALSAGGKVLVHCFMGRSRSATIVLAYLIARHALTLSDALRELRRVRPQAQPNTGFYKELVAFETATQGATGR
ncbi:hypothetical protein PRIC2_004740 [Phytophthora ramorum]